MRTICGTILAAATVFAATSAYAWGSGHDTVARETLKHLPGEWGERLRSGEERVGTDPAKRAFYRAFRDFNPLNDIGIG